MTAPSQRKFAHQAYEAGILLKAVNGCLEAAAGLLLALIPAHAIRQTIDLMTQGELGGGHDDLLHTLIRHLSETFSVRAKFLVALYLMAHGTVKIVMVVALRRKKPWAYPFALWMLSFFIAYQLYRLSYSFSLGLAVLSALDTVILFLIWRESKAVRLRR